MIWKQKILFFQITRKCRKSEKVEKAKKVKCKKNKGRGGSALHLKTKLLFF